MRRTLVGVLSLFLMLGAASEAAGIVSVGVGGFFGRNIPVVQDDASNGSLFGFKARVQFIPLLGVEPFFTKLDQGDTSVEVWGKEMTRDGGAISVFGLNAIFGPSSGGLGVNFNLAAGIGSYTISREGVSDETRFGYNIGPGIEIGFGNGLALEVSSRFHMIPLDGGGSRKNVGISGGINYYLGL